MSMWDVFGTAGFSPHGMCLADSGIIQLDVMANAGIAAAYFALPVQLVVLSVHRGFGGRRQLIGMLFASFILLCGISHTIDILTLFVPVYRFQVLELIATAVVSIATAFILPLEVVRMARKTKG